jgi:hypothetical protein
MKVIPEKQCAHIIRYIHLFIYIYIHNNVYLFLSGRSESIIGYTLLKYIHF